MRFDWRVAPLAELVAAVTAAPTSSPPVLVAINGHSSSGKSTLATRLVDALPDAAVLHTDDLAGNQGVFAWDVLLRDEVLPVVRAGEPLNDPPPQWWQARGRTGSVTLPGSVVEGVGASQASVRDAYDVVVWVETEEPTRLARDLLRLAAGEMSSPGAYAGWMAEENAYTTHQRPWEHADLLVYGGNSIPHDPTTEVVLSDLSGARGAQAP